MNKEIETNMKKLLILLPLMMMALSGCSANGQNAADNKVSDTPKETVTLSATNFSTYVACNSSVTFNNSTNDYANYFTYFIGADYCKFVNCTVTYGYAYMANAYEGAGETVPLTLSGDGQANPYHVRINTAAGYYRFVVVAASGTVEVYR